MQVAKKRRDASPNAAKLLYYGLKFGCFQECSNPANNKDRFVCQYNSVYKQNRIIAATQIAKVMATFAISCTVHFILQLLLSIDHMMSLIYTEVHRSTASLCLDLYLSGCDQVISGDLPKLDKLSIQSKEDGVCKQECGAMKCSVLTFTSSQCFTIVAVAINLHKTYYQDLIESDGYGDTDILRPIGKDIDPVSLPRNQQSFTNPVEQEVMAPQVNFHDTDEPVADDNENDGIQQSNTVKKDGEQPLEAHTQEHHVHAPYATNVHCLQSEEIRNNQPSMHMDAKSKADASLGQEAIENDGKLSMMGGNDQAEPVSNIPSEHKPMVQNVDIEPADHNPSVAHIVKGLPKQTELLPTVGPQHDALYSTNFEHEVQSSREEVRQKRNARTTFYQHEFEQHAYNPIKTDEINPPKHPPVNDKLQVKVPEIKAETGKAANDFKPKPLPKRSCIVCGGKQYPLVNNLISHPHMDHYFVKERTEIRPSHYLAKLVLRHQYLNR